MFPLLNTTLEVEESPGMVCLIKVEATIEREREKRKWSKKKERENGNLKLPMNAKKGL